MSETGASARPALEAVFDPASVAIVGASATPAKRGHQILSALAESGYAGAVYPVNPRGGEILGRAVFESIEALPEGVDLAVLCTPAAPSPDLVAACGRRGVRAALVLAVGFGESGPEGERLQAQLVEAGRRYGVRIVGPNTSGLLNLHRGLNLIGARGVRAGGLALLVQSGNMALALMNEATEKTRDGISICVGLGNEADVGFAESLDYLAGHSETAAIVVYVEGFRDGRGFLEAAARVSPHKPIVAIKAGRSPAGARSARSHTGAVAGPYERLRAGFRQAGVVEVERTDELLFVAHTLARQRPPAAGRGIGILSDGGGQGTLAADVLTALGAPLAELSASTRASLSELMGPAAATANPVDLAGAADADPGVFAAALELLASDEGVGAVLLVGLFGGYGIRFDSGLTEAEVAAAVAMADRMRQRGRGMVVHTMYADSWSRPLETLAERGVSVVRSLETACRCVAELQRRAPGSGPAWTPAAVEAAGPEHPVFLEARADGRDALTEPEARTLLAESGLPLVRARAATSPQDAAAVARRVGFPVAVKLVSGRFTHKSEVGGVILGVCNEEAVAAAFERVTGGAADLAIESGRTPEAAEVLVAAMEPPPLLELLVGAARDPQLGPFLTVGAGGRWAELIQDTAHRLLPVEDGELERLLEELRLSPILLGARGQPPVDRGSVVRAIRAVADCLLRHGAIEGVEVNPLFAYSDRVVGVDARIILCP